MVNDLRKIAGIEAYAPTDNAAELTARINDDGWSTTFEEWLKVSRLTILDIVFVLSVGGGNALVSVNITKAVYYANEKQARVLAIVGERGGETAEYATACVFVPVADKPLTTPYVESMQTLIWHLMVNHPKLKC